MEIALHAFRLAFRVAKVSTIEEGLKDILSLPNGIIEKQIGPWEYQLLAQAVLHLRRRGLPEPTQTDHVLFRSMINVLRSCKEPTDDDPVRSGGPRPAA